MIITLKTPIKFQDQEIKEIELQRPLARGKDIGQACSKMAGFVIGAENRAQLETVKAVQDIDFDKLGGTAKSGKIETDPKNLEQAKPNNLELAKQMVARCCMVDGDFTAELVERFSAVYKFSPNVMTYLGMPLPNDAFQQLDWQDAEVVASVYSLVFMLS